MWCRPVGHSHQDSRSGQTDPALASWLISKWINTGRKPNFTFSQTDISLKTIPNRNAWTQQLTCKQATPNCLLMSNRFATEDAKPMVNAAEDQPVMLSLSVGPCVYLQIMLMLHTSSLLSTPKPKSKIQQTVLLCKTKFGHLYYCNSIQRMTDLLLIEIPPRNLFRRGTTHHSKGSNFSAADGGKGLAIRVVQLNDIDMLASFTGILYVLCSSHV